MSVTAHLSAEQRQERGRALRAKAHRSSHATGRRRAIERIRSRCSRRRTPTGWTRARAHARSGEPIAISGYLGSGDAFDEAIGQFSERYADQNGLDHGRFVEQIDSGKLEVEKG